MMPQERSPLDDDDDGVGTVPTSRPFQQQQQPAVASPADWGADTPPTPKASPFPPIQSPAAAPAFPPIQSTPSVPVFPPMRAPSSPNLDFPKGPIPRPGRQSLTGLNAIRPLGTGVGGGPAGSLPDDARSADPLAISGWRKARGGLFWVLCGLLVLTLPGFVGFAKAVCVRAGIDLPQGPGDGWLSISGYINSPDPNSVRMSKEEIFDLLVYGGPMVLGGVLLAFGRITCGAVPRSSGGKGMFALSGLFTLIAVASLIAAIGCDKLLFKEEYQYARYAFLISALAAEFWCLTGMAVCGIALKRPKAARSVGMVGMAVAFVAAAATIGWMLYVKQYRSVPVTDTAKMYEQAAAMLGWLLVVGTYWRAVRSVRGAVSELVESTDV